MSDIKHKYMAAGMLISYFLIQPVLNVLRIGGATAYVIIGGAIYLFFMK